MLNEKRYEEPVFFTISNLGGGGSDKYRETVYVDLLENTATLYNYFYIVQSNYPNTSSFAVKWLKNINNYNKFSDFIKYTRKEMIKEGYSYSGHEFAEYDYEKTVYLLDSGAANFINLLHKEINYEENPEEFKSRLIKIMHSYYDFADKFKFDIVIGFDLGGKYTFKGDERKEQNIISGNKSIKENSLDLNEHILNETIKYLKSKKEFYPKIYATVHGNTKEEYADYARLILKKEKENDFRFDGFALGGIASSKGVDFNLWGINDERINELKKLVNKSKSVSLSEAKNALMSTIACRSVSSVVGERHIHALGAGGKLNIIPLWNAGATSFDTQTPGRRAYDGSGEYVINFNNPQKGNTFSKYLPGIIDSDLNKINEEETFEYQKINELNESIEQCNCKACKVASIDDIKNLYCSKDTDNEAYYYSRQLMNIHAIHQHNFLCDLIKEHRNFDTILDNLDRDDISNIIRFIANNSR